MEILQFILSSVITGWAISCLYRDAWRATTPQPDGLTTLRYGRSIWLLGSICGLMVPAGMLMIATTAGFRDSTQIYPFSVLMICFTLAGWWLLLEARLTSFTISSQGIESRFLWRQPLWLNWQDVQDVQFDSSKGYVILIGPEGKRVHVNVLLVGFPLFIKSLVQHLPEAIYENALAELAISYG